MEDAPVDPVNGGGLAFRKEVPGPEAVAGAGVPDLDRAVERGRDDPVASGAPVARPDHAGVAIQGEQALARGCVPDLDRVVAGAGDDPVAFRAPSARHHLAGMALQIQQALARGSVPDLERAVV